MNAEQTPTPLPNGKTPLTFAAALAVFAAAFAASRSVPASITAAHPWARQAVTQGLLAAFSVVAMVASRRPLAEFGFRRPTPAPGRFLLWGFLLGAASAGLILLLGLRGMKSTLASYGLPGVIFWIWLVSSTVEELFCRGWFQTLAATDAGPNRSVPWSAALFGSMHLTLLLGDVEKLAVLIVVVFVTFLGYVCALARSATGSLRLAVLAHVMFNVGGVAAGIVYTIAYRVTTGHLPPV